MILHTLQRPGFVTDAHDFALAGPTADLEFRRQRAVADNQAVVSCRSEGVGHSDVNRFSIVMDLIRFAVHEALGALDDRAADESDALVPQADAQDRQFGAKMADHIVAHPAFFWRAGAGGNNDVRWLEGVDFLQRHFVITENLQGLLGIDLAQFLHQVIGE